MESEQKGRVKTLLNVLSYSFRILSIIASVVLALFLRMFDRFEDDYFDIKTEIGKELNDPTFWLLTFTLNIVWLVVYYTVYSMRRESLLKQDEWLKIAERYRKLIAMKIRNLVDFIRIVNIKRKKEAYKKRWNRKLTRVQSRIERNMNLLNWRVFRKYASWRIKGLKEKEKRRLDKLDENYINENINYLFAWYNHVSINDFTFNKYTEARITDKTSSNEDKILARTGVQKILVGFVINSIMVMGITILMDGYIRWKQSGFWISLLSIFISCAIQIFFARRNAEKVVDSEIIAPTLVKINLLEESLRWDEADKSNIEFSKILDEQLNPKKIKISKDELDYLEKNRDKIQEEINNKDNQGGIN